jgi:hypothetical protein
MKFELSLFIVKIDWLVRPWKTDNFPILRSKEEGT